MADDKQPDRDVFVVGGPEDGYTFRGTLKAEGKPPLGFAYRPALPEKVYQYRMAVRAAETGEQHFAAVATLLGAHVLRWDVKERGANGQPVPLAFSAGALERPEVRRALGTDYLDQMVNYVTGYTAGQWDSDAKN